MSVIDVVEFSKDCTNDQTLNDLICLSNCGMSLEIIIDLSDTSDAFTYSRTGLNPVQNRNE